MKKIYLILLMFCSICAHAQTIVNYQAWSGTSACNAFAFSTDVPATNPNPILLPHLSTVGQPQYDWVNGSVNLKTTSTEGIKGTEYRITYPFKKNFTYSIQIVAAVQKNGHMVNLRLNLHNGTTGQSSFCLGTELIDPSLSDGMKKAMYVQSGGFSNINFDWNNLSGDYAYICLFWSSR